MEQLRLTGNQHFSSGNFLAAIDSYSQVLCLYFSPQSIQKLIRQGLQVNPECALLYSNRAACFLALKRFAEAESDASRAIQIQYSLIKAHYRLVLALMGLSKFNEAFHASNLALIQDPACQSILKLREECLKMMNRSQDCCDNCAASPSSDLCVTCAPISQKKKRSSPKVSAKIIADLPPLEASILKHLRSLIQSIKSGDRSVENSPVEGLFHKLTNSASFVDTLFPGTPSSVLSSLPSNLLELLSWEPLTVDLSSVVNSAASVLRRVKERGASAGDIMDEATQNFLLPQIAKEALARELVDAVRKLGKKLSLAKAKTSLTVAHMESQVLEEIGRIEPSVISALCTTSTSVQNNFLGREWAQLILDDTERFCSSEKMSPCIDSLFEVNSRSTPPATMAWIEKDQLRDSYPALFECVEALHQIAFEVNGEYLSVTF